MQVQIPQLSALLDTSHTESVLHEVQRLIALTYPQSLVDSVSTAFHTTCQLYRGEYPDYLACRTDYHNLDHSLDVFLATGRLIDGSALNGQALSASLAEALLIGALLHDAGYIQKADDSEGTGAKYTLSHVDRSMSFITEHADCFGLSHEQALSAARMVAATSIAADFSALPFISTTEQWAGSLMVTADLIGQMADRKYLEKLLFLYQEFQEAGFGGYESSFDMLKKTRGFYELIRSRLDSNYLSAYKLAQAHFKVRHSIDQNLYLEAMERQMAYLDAIIADNSTNFRKKLKRLDLEMIAIA